MKADTLPNNTKDDILIVDDTLPNLKVLSEMLNEEGYYVRGAPNGPAALIMINARLPDLVLLDIRMPGMGGYEVCRKLKADQKTSDIPVIFISALEQVAQKVEGFRAGGVDYITKPFKAEEVLARVKLHLSIRKFQNQIEMQNIQLQQEIAERKRAEKESELAREAAEKANKVKSDFLANMSHEIRPPMNAIMGFTTLTLKTDLSREQQNYLHKIKKASDSLLDIINDILDFSKIEAGKLLKAADADANVMIYGESGTGKELVAQAIHAHSERRGKKLVTVNCGAIPENLAESEFFGHKKGAFTGADQDKKGFLEEADRGSLFLDEIGELSLNIQVKLLRAIEGAGYAPLGSRKVIQPDIRIIAASNRNLKELVRKGVMREDFFYRIHIIPICLPPLRERKEDIPLLLEHFLNAYDPDKRPPVNADVLNTLQNYAWPGNVRELRNTIHRYVTLKKIDLVEADLSGVPNDTEINICMRDAEDQTLPGIIEKVERKLITDALTRNHWRRDKSAAALGINRKALYRKMKQYGLSEN